MFKLTPTYQKRGPVVAYNSKKKTTSPREELFAMGGNPEEVDMRVEQEMKEKEAKRISVEEFYSRLDILQKENPSMSPEDVYSKGVSMAKSKGYQVDGMDLDLEIMKSRTTKQQQEMTQEEPIQEEVVQEEPIQEGVVQEEPIQEEVVKTDFLEDFNKTREENAKLEEDSRKTDEQIWIDKIVEAKLSGKTIEGINLDEELDIFGVDLEDIIKKQKSQSAIQIRIEKEEQSKQSVEDGEKSFVKEQAKDVGKFLEKQSPKVLNAIENLALAAFTNIPEMQGNILSFFLDPGQVVGVKGFGTGIAEYVQSEGEKTSKFMSEKLGVEEDTISSMLGELGAEILTMLTPGVGPVKGTASASKGIQKIKSGDITKIEKLVSKIKDQTPEEISKVRNFLTSKFGQSATKGVREAAAFDIINEGDITATSLAVGVVANPLVDTTGNFIKGIIGKDAIGLLTKAIRPSKMKGTVLGNQAKESARNMEITGETILLSGKKPSSEEELLDVMLNRKNTMYDEVYKPALEQSKVIINLNKSIDEAAESVIGNKKLAGGADEGVLFNMPDGSSDLKRIVDEWKKIGDASVEQIETVQRRLAALKRLKEIDPKSGLSGVDEQFLGKMDKILQDELDAALTSVLGEKGVSGFKREYLGIMKVIADIDARILVNRRSGVSLFEGLGRISGFTNIVEGLLKGNPQQIAGGATSLLVGDGLKRARDPDELIQKAVRQLYKDKDKKFNVADLFKGGKGAAYSGAGSTLDDYENGK